MLKVILCDDNREMINRYAELIKQCAEKLQLDIELSCFYSGESLFFYLWETPHKADIIYLDIIMEDLDGMAAARKLREIGCSAQIIFLTTWEEYMNEAFDVKAIHYLIKEGFSEEKFQQVFADAVKMAEKKEKELFICEFDGYKTAIEIDSITHFEIWKRLVTVYCRDGSSAKFYGNMGQLVEAFADKNFARSHRSYLVHLPYIAQFQPHMLLLKTGVYIPIGGTYSESLSKAFSDYALRTHVFRDGWRQDI